MSNELMLDLQQIVVVQGSVEFNEYESILLQAEKLAEQVAQIEVSEENLKASKKLLAAVNKRVKELEDKRITVKKAMLEPYQLFEDQVKNIVTIVKNADAEVRQQIKYLEENERHMKEEVIEELFYKRKRMYSLGDLIEFNDFLQPRHLNKTVSLEAVEKEMIDFLEKTEKDYNVILGLDDPEGIVSVYINCFDLAQAISQGQVEKQRREHIQASGALKKAVSNITTYRINVFDEKDFKLLEMFMQQNKIKYEVDEITFGGF